MTHPEALVSKLAEAMESIFDQWQPPESYERMAARAVLDLFEVREEHVNPNQYLYGGPDVPQNGPTLHPHDRLGAHR